MGKATPDLPVPGSRQTPSGESAQTCVNDPSGAPWPARTGHGQPVHRGERWDFGAASECVARADELPHRV